MTYNRQHRIKKNGHPGPPAGVRYSRPKLKPPGVSAAGKLNVRSRYEKECVEYFEEQGIDYKYEPLIILAGKQYRPDFYLPGLDLFIEICGFTHMPYYTDRVEQKKQLYSHSGLKAVFIVHTGRGSIKEKLRRALETYEK